MLYNKALCVYHCLFKRFSNVENVPIKVLVKLFSSMVIPVLLYGCEICGPFLLGKITSFETFKTKILKITNQIEKLHLKLCKRILGVHSKSTNLAVYGEIGQTPLIVQIATFIAKFWCHIKSATLTNNLASDAAEYACNPIYNQFYSQNIYYSYVILRLIILKTLSYIK